MLTDEIKAQIREEERYRQQVHASIKPEPSFWKMLNSPLVIVLITTVFINGSIYIFQSVKSSFTEGTEIGHQSIVDKQAVDSLVLEIGARLFHLEGRLTTVQNEKTRQSLRTALSAPFHLLPEYKDHANLMALNWELTKTIFRSPALVPAEETNEVLHKSLAPFTYRVTLLLSGIAEVPSSGDQNPIPEIGKMAESLIKDSESIRNRLAKIDVEYSFWKSMGSLLFGPSGSDQ